jgi:hypothetical protein
LIIISIEMLTKIGRSGFLSGLLEKVAVFRGGMPTPAVDALVDIMGGSRGHLASRMFSRGEVPAGQLTQLIAHVDSLAPRVADGLGARASRVPVMFPVFADRVIPTAEGALPIGRAIAGDESGYRRVGSLYRPDYISGGALVAGRNKVTPFFHDPSGVGGMQRFLLDVGQIKDIVGDDRAGPVIQAMLKSKGINVDDLVAHPGLEDAIAYSGGGHVQSGLGGREVYIEPRKRPPKDPGAGGTRRRIP